MSDESKRAPAELADEQREDVAGPAGSETASERQGEEDSAAPALGVEELEQRIAPAQIV